MFIIEGLLSLGTALCLATLWFPSPARQAKWLDRRARLDRTKLLADRALVLAEESKAAFAAY